MLFIFDKNLLFKENTLIFVGLIYFCDAHRLGHSCFTVLIVSSWLTELNLFLFQWENFYVTVCEARVGYWSTSLMADTADTAPWGCISHPPKGCRTSSFLKKTKYEYIIIKPIKLWINQFLFYFVLAFQASLFAVRMGFPYEDLTTQKSLSLYSEWLNQNCQPNYWKVQWSDGSEGEI